ncbi:thiosulfate oxidation carrier complex protein SoxZ [Maritalea porphyrae]|jgi:sulfur-oxidizing protein SoxZ|uniref:thiosulfate oxidation carrier complex protein SoxZ n=1 Tax=Maritalea porphyrae TaxID=880732 RepID=UPI0022AE9099|nr:thiosulfate oxidation carrier complex protein SoxZ [Maritalea porphyrae]MCZ4271229.1 thiosulfate oxidation carrier complex protein SoxZ [Maritalea porphyrae]
MASKPRVKVPKKAAAGDIITIKTLISHAMESGQRKGKDGNLIPRKIINKFTADFNGTTVFSADLEPGIAANPFIEFNVKVMESGTFNFVWLDDDGTQYSSSNEIAVE